MSILYCTVLEMGLVYTYFYAHIYKKNQKLDIKWKRKDQNIKLYKYRGLYNKPSLKT